MTEKKKKKKRVSRPSFKHQIESKSRIRTKHQIKSKKKKKSNSTNFSKSKYRSETFNTVSATRTNKNRNPLKKSEKITAATTNKAWNSYLIECSNRIAFLQPWDKNNKEDTTFQLDLQTLAKSTSELEIRITNLLLRATNNDVEATKPFEKPQSSNRSQI